MSHAPADEGKLTDEAGAAPRVNVVSALRRRLGLFDVLCIGVNATVGSGVFALPDDMQRAMGGWSPLAYLFCAILLLPVALSFAELSGHFDESGGAYVYARSAFGNRIGFLVGWFCWAATFVSWAANTTLLVDLLGFHAYPWNKLLAAFVILALGAINYVGVKPGAWVVNLVVIGKLGAIACFILAAFFALDPSRLGGPLPQGLAGVGTGVYLALFPLQGFEVAPVVAGETANPRRNVPLGTMGSLLLSALLFIIVQAALVATYPGLARESETPLADAAHHLGPRVGLIVLIGSFVSIGGFTAGSALGSPRYAEAIASHGLLPRVLARIHQRWSTPYVAILVTTLLSAVLAFFFDYRRLVGMANVTVVIQYFSTCIAVPFIRRQAAADSKAVAKLKADKEAEVRALEAKDVSAADKEAHEEKLREIEAQLDKKEADSKRKVEAWRIPGGIAVPLLGAVGSLGLFAAADRKEWIFAAATLALGVVVAKLSARPTASRSNRPSAG